MSCTPNLVRIKKHSVTSFDNNYFNISRGEKFNKGHKGSSGYVYQVVANHESNDMKRLFAIRLNQTLQICCCRFLNYLSCFLELNKYPSFYNQSIHTFFSQSYNFLMDALEGYRIHQDQNNASKGTRSTIRIHKIILIITTERLQL